MKEAMEEVKSELGRDAVILHTKKYQEGGFLGYKSKDVVEVTAAVEDQPQGVKRSAPGAKPAMPLVPPQVLGQYKTNGTQAGIDLVSSPIQAPQFKRQEQGEEELRPRITLPPEWQEALDYKPPQRGAGDGKPQGEQPPVSRDSLMQAVDAVLARQEALAAEAEPAMADTGPAEEQAEPVEAETEEETAAEEETAEAAEEADVREMQQQSQEDAAKIHKLEEELAQMKTLLAQVMSKDQPKDEISLQEALRRQEVGEDILKDMAAQAPAGSPLLDCLDPKAREILAEYLDRVVNFSEGIQLNRHGVRTVALIGATGVGKTTTLAKIAARFVLEKGVKAALITADTYRISAVEQLKTYSDIIGLPLEIVYTPQELKVALHKHRDKDLLLIDTAGRSQHNEYQMKELQEFLAVDKRIEKHLVMSATTKSRDAADILEKFSVCNPDRVIFTKTDETSSVGLILNLLRDKEIALSYLTNGQSVPDDIIPATPAQLAELLLRE